MTKLVSEFRPVPAPPRQSMLRKGAITPDDLLGALSRSTKDKVDQLSDKLSKALEGAIQDVFGSGRGSGQKAGQFVAAVLSRVSESLLDQGVPGGPLLAPDVVKKAMDRAVSDLESQGKISKDVADSLRAMTDKLVEGVRERAGPLAKGILNNLDVTNLSDDQYRKLMDMVAKADLKPHGVGVGPGAGMLTALWAKLLTDPRTRAYIRSRIRDLRTAAYFREMRWPKGKRLEPRATFRKYFRTGMPFPPVYRTRMVRPKTREDVIFFVDVSGSMAPAYPVTYAIMKAMEDLGLNVRMYAGDTRVEFVTDVDRALSEVGGGGTAIGKGVAEILSSLGSTLKDTSFIVYTDLEFDPEDFELFVSSLDKVRGVGSKVSVWVYDCGLVQSFVDRLEQKGFNVVCDVRSMEDMLHALNRMRKELVR